MTYTREDFIKRIAAEVTKQPLAAQYYQVGDPRLIAQLDAMATAMSMISQQIDTQSMEAFIKARDTTVLADASMKGILPFSRPARATVTVRNDSDVQLTVLPGRRLIGPQSRVFISESGVAIAPGASATIAVKQLTMRTHSHTVSNSVPFYSAPVPPSSDPDLTISGVQISIGGVQYPYTPEFSNMAVGQAGFTLETDENRALFAKFGWDNTFGIQPPNGAVIDFIIEESGGLSDLPINASFSFENMAAAADQFATLTLASVEFPGANPIDIQSMRELARYPGVYDASAVYLGNFDFNVRRNLPQLRFLSVWNEKIEESVRPASVKNINRLFIAALVDGATAEWIRSTVTGIINAADDSYFLSFVTPVESVLPVTINAQVSVVHDPADVISKVKSALITLYGRDSVAASRGMLMLSHKRVYDAVRAQVPALQDEGSDFQIVLSAPGAVKPEEYRYVSADSITVNVTAATYNDGMWSH